MLDAENLPGVSFIMPVLNEAEFIIDSIEAITRQNYPGEWEIILALGPSTDGTNELVTEYMKKNDKVKSVTNQKTDIPIGLNLAIKKSKYPIIIRVDAHSEISEKYAEKGVKTLLKVPAASLGGVMLADGKTSFQKAVARAYNHPFGLGGGSYHTGVSAGPAESAYLGIFDKKVIAEVGYYDENLKRGEDWELNQRIIKAGYQVWFDPELKVTYWPRDSVKKLAQQFKATGVWRAKIVRKNGWRSPLRFYAPPLLFINTILSLILSCIYLSNFITPIGITYLILNIPITLYLITLIIVCLKLKGKLSLKDRLYSAVVFVTMHYCWAYGFIMSTINSKYDTVDKSRVS